MADVGGLDKEIQAIRDLIDIPLNNPKRLLDLGKLNTHIKCLGLKPPRGILLYGSSGTGKTMLAHALAKDMGVYFCTLNGSEMMKQHYGESEAKASISIHFYGSFVPCLSKSFPIALPFFLLMNWIYYVQSENK